MIIEVPQLYVMWNFTKDPVEADLHDYVKKWCDESGIVYTHFSLKHSERWPKRWFYIEMPKDKAMLFKLRWL